MAWVEISPSIYKNELSEDIHDCRINDCGCLYVDGDTIFCEISGICKTFEKEEIEDERRIIHRVVKRTKNDELSPSILLHQLFEKLMVFTNTDKTEKIRTMLKRIVSRSGTTKNTNVEYMKKFVSDEKLYSFVPEEQEYWVNNTILIYSSQEHCDITIQYVLIGLLLYAASSTGLKKNKQCYIEPHLKIMARLPLEHEFYDIVGIRSNLLTQILKYTKVKLKWNNHPDIHTPLSYKKENVMEQTVKKKSMTPT